MTPISALGLVRATVAILGGLASIAASLLLGAITLASLWPLPGVIAALVGLAAPLLPLALAGLLAFGNPVHAGPLALLAPRPPHLGWGGFMVRRTNTTLQWALLTTLAFWPECAMGPWLPLAGGVWLISVPVALIQALRHPLVAGKTP